ncbi:hypothetical protein [Amycolatopsis antarctica]|uniref:hypothetical protein n=1 Tax=Amycolatopsis antarctica TaxID=1854586 RepID=UPI001F0A3B66|nr:hypothetical protein [Amycolatopsis antarctica]
MDQISMFSAEASGPAVEDLAGVLCGPGRIVSFARTTARLSVLVEQRSRARALAAEYRRRRVHAEVMSTECGRFLVRTAFRADLISLAEKWSDASGKTVPGGFRLDGAALRLWALAAGVPAETGYLLPFDPGAPWTHEPLAAAVDALGLAGRVLTERAGGPGVCVRGRRRLEQLAELLGSSPGGVTELWPCPPPSAARAERPAVAPNPAPGGTDGRELGGEGQLDLLSA